MVSCCLPRCRRNAGGGLAAVARRRDAASGFLSWQCTTRMRHQNYRRASLCRTPPTARAPPPNHLAPAATTGGDCSGACCVQKRRLSSSNRPPTNDGEWTNQHKRRSSPSPLIPSDASGGAACLSSSRQGQGTAWRIRAHPGTAVPRAAPSPLHDQPPCSGSTATKFKCPKCGNFLSMQKTDFAENTFYCGVGQPYYHARQ